MSLLHKPVVSLSIKGKILVSLLWSVYALYDFFVRPRKAKEFEENPLTMSKAEAFYLGYKYYYRSPEPSEESKVFFRQNPFEIDRRESKDETVSISLGGDLMPYKQINRRNCRHLWEQIGEYYFGADLVFANLETPLVETEPPFLVPEVMLGNMNFNASEEQFDVFSGFGKYKGFDVLSVANNHTLDKGEEGVKSTLDFLKRKGIKAVGAACRPDRDEDIALTEKNGFKIGWLAFTYCFNHHTLPQGKEYLANELPLNLPDLDTTAIKTKVEKLKAKGAEFIIGSFHMGNAYQPMPEKNIRNNVKKIIDECAIDFFVGTHPHNPQPLAVIENKYGKKVPVIFSLGDFVAWDIYTYCHLSWVVKFQLGRDSEGNVILTRLDKKLLYCMMDKESNLTLLPMEYLTEHKQELKAAAKFPEEIDKAEAFCRTYLK